MFLVFACVKSQRQHQGQCTCGRKEELGFVIIWLAAASFELCYDMGMLSKQVCLRVLALKWEVRHDMCVGHSNVAGP